ncbi:ATP-binding protein [Natronoglycomyces albus]|uniref:AAA family ATPase n=1 Tax=Natronoglycomyces albus TaxID=2811108 RepID=A0A895XK69_9ACTN|nr:AAA family ATPase [Natronoglycomyces albus]QSB05437.1 AAA family ATPase [Natronoglycomyces albus]
MSNSLLIGRQHPAATLSAAARRAKTSHGGLVLVTGEAGIGKTTLVTSIAAQTARDNHSRDDGDPAMLIVVGSSWESEAVPGYWPWTQILRSLKSQLTSEQWESLPGTDSVTLSILLGDAPALDMPSTKSNEEFLLHDAVVRLLSAASRLHPLLVILDDLHFADPATVRLLQFAVQHTWFERILFVGTYRDMEIEFQQHQLRPLLLPLVSKATLITLTGLDTDEVAQLIETSIGQRPEPHLVEAITRRTGGNPFYVEQAAQLLATGAHTHSTTPGMRNSLQRRLDQVPRAVLDTLTLAAVIGHEFDAELIADSSGAPLEQVQAHLKEATQQRLIVHHRKPKDDIEPEPLRIDPDGEPIPVMPTVARASSFATHPAGNFEFVHDLVRETLYAQLPTADVRKLHAKVFAALARSRPDQMTHSASMARHVWLAEDEVAPADAVDVLAQAATDASARLSFDEGITLLRRAIDRCTTEELQGRRIVLRTSYAGNLHFTGREEEAWRIFEECLLAAEATNDPLIVARVALELPLDPKRRDLCADRKRHALELLSHTPVPPDLTYTELTRQLTIKAAVTARRRGDDEALGFSLWVLHSVVTGPGTAKSRLPVIDELIGVSERSGDRETMLFASSLRWVVLFELGDPSYYRQLQEFISLANKTNFSRWIVSARLDGAIHMIVQGRFAEAQRVIESSRVYDTESMKHDAMAANFWEPIVDYFKWFAELTRTAEQLPDIGTLSRNNHIFGLQHMDLLYGIAALHRGHLTRAIEHYRSVDMSMLAQGWSSLWYRLSTEIAIATDDDELRDRMRTELAPYEGEWMVSLFGSEISGPVSYWLGLMDASVGQHESAIAFFDKAIESARIMTANAWVVRALSKKAISMAALGHSAASELAQEVADWARKLDMPRILRSAEQLIACDGVPVIEGGNVFRKEGSTWTLRFAGKDIHLAPAKGLNDLHLLLSQPGSEIAATELLDPAGGNEVTHAARLGGDDMIDQEAKARYREHLQRLDEQIDTATALGQDDVAADLDEERSSLIEQLRAATGLGGRSRKLGDNAERARKSVTNRIRNTLKRIESQHPELGAHLRSSVSTGFHCVYEPSDPDIKWEL